MSIYSLLHQQMNVEKHCLLVKIELKDLEDLGDRYKDSRVNQEQQMADLRIAQMEWQRRAEYLEAKCQEHEIEVKTDSSPSTSTSATTVTMSGPLMKFHEKLRLSQAAAKHTQVDLQTQVKTTQLQVEQTELARAVLEQEVQRLNDTVAKLETATFQQQEALQKAQEVAQEATAQATAATNAAAAASTKKKKKKGFFGIFGKKSKKTSSPPPTPPPLPPIPSVDVTAALVPMQAESKRFDVLHERMQAQSKALLALQQEYKRVARQKNQLEQTVMDLRLEQEQDKAAVENQAFQELQAKLEQVEAQKAEEHAEAQATIEQLRAQLAALEAKNA